MPAIYGLIWTTPRYVVDGLIGGTTKFFKDRTFDELFRLMVDDQDIDVKFNYDVIVSLCLLTLFFRCTEN